MNRMTSAAIIAFMFASGICAGDSVMPASSVRLPDHERCVFAVRWLGVRVGTITASIKGIKEINGRKAYELEATAKTSDLCSRIYPVDDRYVSYMDVEDLRTLRHEVYRKEGRYRKNAVTDFDRSANKAYFRNMLDGSRKTIDVPPNVQDALSAGYYFRTIPIEMRRQIAIKVYNNEEVYDLFGVADKVRRLNIPSVGVVEAFHIQPYAQLKGEAVRKGRASGYFSLDERRLPLLVRIRAPLFTEVTGYLEKLE